MNIFKVTIIGIIVASVTILVPTMILSYTPEKIIEYGCTPDFWKNNLELWETVDVDYNDDFDVTFGTSTGEKLVQRGWGLLEDDSIEKAMPHMPSWNDGTAKSEIMAFVLVHRDLVVYLIQWASQV
jgi:hypothetical protein